MRCKALNLTFLQSRVGRTEQPAMLKVSLREAGRAQSNKTSPNGISVAASLRRGCLRLQIDLDSVEVKVRSREHGGALKSFFCCSRRCNEGTDETSDEVGDGTSAGEIKESIEAEEIRESDEVNF
ncbi:hypothetical protein MRB53_002635 [Persea americana]|uniref:Uncharacterized protein n=1 Tax=Persea americana TaxID=3435 RepID=A0ACC2MV19_PERAE|nr:hypothetical protein MRB53_002635 [Persea americana]